jgi:hypothetical protein
MDMIGQSYTIWTKGNTVVYFEAGADTVQEFTAKADVTEKTAGMKVSGAAQFVNFSDEVASSYTADIRIAYAYANGGKSGVIQAGDTILTSSDEYKDLEDIFTKNQTEAWVAIGTKNATADNDISDSISFKRFLAEYMTDSSKSTAIADTNENGNYVKVIDNDGDGEAEYILKTAYTMDEIIGTTTKGPDTYYVLNDKDAENKNITVAADAIVTEDELAVGDVVLYALIDGVYYLDVVTPVTETVSSINYKTETITCESENTYEQSYITDRTTMLNAVAEMAKNSSYNLYLDKYGYVRAYIEASYGDYVLLTEMYRDTTDRNNLIKDGNYTVETVDAAGEIANYTVANVAGVKAFYAGTTDYNLLAGNGLKKAAEGAWTNVASALIDGTSINLATAEQTYRYKSGKTIETGYYDLTAAVKEAETNAISKGQRRFYFDDDYVNITSNTTVYLVYGENDSSLTKAVVGTGYNAIPAIDNANTTINKVYAVATTTYEDSNAVKYPVADVLVIEIKDTYTKDFVLAYQPYTKTVDAILSDGTTDDVSNADEIFTGTIGFYDLVNNKIAGTFSFADQITSGVVHEKNKLLDYIDFYAWSNGKLAEGAKNVTTLDYDETLPVYTLAKRGTTVVAEVGTVADLKAGNEIIVVWKDARHSAPAYIVNVTDSVAALTTVYDAYKGTVPATDLALETLKLNGIAVDLEKLTVDMTNTEANDTGVVDFAATANKTGATITVNGYSDTTKTGTFTDGQKVVVTVSKDGESKDYIITVNVAAASKDATITGITVKGKAASLQASATNDGSTSAKAITYKVTLSTAEAAATTTEQLLVATTQKNATVAVSNAGTTTIDTTNFATKKTSVSAGDVEFDVTPETGSGDKVYYKVTVEIAKAATAAFDDKDAAHSELTTSNGVMTLSVPAGVTVTKDNYTTYLDVTPGSDSKIKSATVSGNVLTIVMTDDGNNTVAPCVEDTTYNINIVNETITLSAAATAGTAISVDARTGNTAWTLKVSDTASDVAEKVGGSDYNPLTITATSDNTNAETYSAITYKYTCGGEEITTLGTAQVGKTVTVTATVKNAAGDTVKTGTYTLTITR